MAGQEVQRWTIDEWIVVGGAGCTSGRSIGRILRMNGKITSDRIPASPVIRSGDIEFSHGANKLFCVRVRALLSPVDSKKMMAGA